MLTVDIIRPILVDIYGDNGMTRALAEDLAPRIAGHRDRDPYFFGDTQRKDMIRNTIWLWFSGGGTAQIAADRIVAAIDAHRSDEYSRDAEHRYESMENDEYDL